MNFNGFKGESPDNYEQKCLCVLVLDVSGSMQGEPINELNNGLQEFHKEVINDFVASQRLEAAIITFGSSINCIQEPALVNNFQMPVLSTSGTTKLVDAVRMSMDMVKNRKQWYKDTGQLYYRPFIILITDGEPDSDQDMIGLSKELYQSVNEKHFTFFTLGVKGFNYQKLQQLCPPPTQPLVLEGYKFANFFKWLSNSIGFGIIQSGIKGEKQKMLPVSDYNFVTQIEF